MRSSVDGRSFPTGPTTWRGRTTRIAAGLGAAHRRRQRYRGEGEGDREWRVKGCRYLGFLKTNFEIPNTSFQFLDWDSFVLIRNWGCRLSMNSYRRALNSPNSFPNKKWLKCPYLQRQKCNFTIKQLNKMLKLGQSVAAIYIHFWVSTQRKKEHELQIFKHRTQSKRVCAENQRERGCVWVWVRESVCESWRMKLKKGRFYVFIGFLGF